MFFVLSKLVSILLVPLHLLVISFFIFMVICFWLKKFNYRILLLFCVFWFILLYKPIPEFLVKSLEDKYSYEESKLKSLQGVIVLGGGTGSGGIAKDRNDWNLGEGSERIIKAFEYIQNVPEGKILFTGMSGGLNFRGLSEAAIANQILSALKINDSNVNFEDKSKNTYQNAIFSKQIIDKSEIKKWGIITSATHMDRAISTFRKNLPDKEFEALPVDFKTGNSLYLFPGNMSGSLSLWHIYIHEFIGFWAYKITGRL